MKIAVVAQRTTHHTFYFSLCRIFRKLRILLLCGIFTCLCRMLTQSSSRRIVFSFQRKNLHFLLQNDAVSFVVFFADVETCTNTMICQMFKMFCLFKPFPSLQALTYLVNTNVEYSSGWSGQYMSIPAEKACTDKLLAGSFLKNPLEFSTTLNIYRRLFTPHYLR